ncbi:MAG: hypothetical protein LBG88_03795, partial [Christensenellaceae bacterium]|nr:hypothetical protein [Christensenellaceae bacterium]
MKKYDVKKFLPFAIVCIAFACGFLGFQIKATNSFATSFKNGPYEDKDIVYTNPLTDEKIYRLEDKTYDKITYPYHVENIGYHCFVRTLLVLDESRYIVADIAGVKIMSTNGTSIEVVDFPRTAPNTTHQEAQLTASINSITYDNWQNVYLTHIDGTVYHFTVNDRNKVEYKGEYIGEIPSEPLTNALGLPITDVDVFSGISPIPPAGKWSLDRVTGRVYYTVASEPHDIKSFLIDDYWNPTLYTHLKWRDLKIDFVEIQGIPPTNDAPISANLFMQTKQPTILFKYPNEIQPKLKLDANEKVQVLSGVSHLFNADGTDAATDEVGYGGSFGYSYVLYKSQALYVKNTDLKAVDFSTKTLNFHAENTPYDQGNNWVGYSARVLMHKLPIYKYPFQDTALIINRLNRNFGGLTDNTPVTSDLGLKINREITVIDSKDRTYYEIRIDANGNPTATGAFVGYVDKGYVMDSFLGPDRQKFVPNARIVAKRDEQVKIYPDANGENPYDDVLLNRDSIEIVGKLDKTATYTQIMYYGFDRAHA